MTVRGNRVLVYMRMTQLLLAGDAAHVHSPTGGQGMIWASRMRSRSARFSPAVRTACSTSTARRAHRPGGGDDRSADPVGHTAANLRFGRPGPAAQRAGLPLTSWAPRRVRNHSTAAAAPTSTSESAVANAMMVDCCSTVAAPATW